MNVTEVLQFVDQLVFERTGKHLDDVQQAVIEGSYKGQTYNEIAESNHFNKSHVGEIGGELWKFLSEVLGEDIKKTNFRSTVERLQITSLPIIIQNNDKQNNNHTFNFGVLNSNQPIQKDQESDTNTKSQSYYHDLTLAPKIIKFYNRETELQTLSNWILNHNTPLISVLGLSGIGKSYLVRKFIDLNLEQFEVIIWKSLKYSQSLDLWIDDILNICKIEIKPNSNNKIKQVFDIFIQKRCLIILDNIETIFTHGQFAGQYQPAYQDYQKFFQMITEINHQSSIILISQEKCNEMDFLDQQLSPVKSLELLGLNDINILDKLGLNNQDSWLQLIQLYQGNSNYLKDIITLIQDVYDGEVAEFLAENTLIITQNMQFHFHDLFNRLSAIEQQIILELSKLNLPISREYLKQNVALSSVEFVKGLQSLQQRYLVTKIKEDKMLFKLSPVFREYVINNASISF
ncbi:MAG: NB-ARC domain-containing protein [Dolichospermum sp.]